MELIEKLKKSSLVQNATKFPNVHIIAASVLSFSLLLLSFVPGQDASAQRQKRSLPLPLPAEESELSSLSAPVEELPQKKHQVQTLKVQSGDSLAVIFQRAGLSNRQLMNFLNTAEKSSKLESIRPAHTLKFELDDAKQIVSLEYVISRLNSYTFQREGEGYTYTENQRQPDVRKASRSGTIKSSLYLAGMESGMDDKLIMKLAEVFGWDIDFALDIRSGDSFRILYEERFLDGEKLDNGAILSAEFINQGQSFKAVRYQHANGRIEYYTPEGRNMRKAFLRAPVDFRRISDGFNPKRLHPVTKTVRPHRGIDYAARTGTPIWSSGDGKVIAAGYSKANGNYIFIQHGNNVQTKYLHLHKRHVKKGQRVRQKQVIGTVGSTGLVTGPHLHYEFLLNGVHRNPRTILQKLPKADSIPSTLKQDFIDQTQPLVTELLNDPATQLALSEKSDAHPAL